MEEQFEKKSWWNKNKSNQKNITAAQQIKVKEEKRKIKSKPPKSSLKQLEYEEQTRANRKRAKEIKRAKRKRQGITESSDDNSDSNFENRSNNNFTQAPLSKATKKKRKRLAKKAKKKSKYERKNDSSSNNSSSSSSSSEDNTPTVRYTNIRENGGRSKFKGIEKMKEKPKMKRKKKSKTKETKEIIGIELEFKSNNIEYMQMLSKPDGVLCGGESIMYYKNDINGKEYFYLATDDDEDIIGILEYDLFNDKWIKYVEYPKHFRPDLHGNCIDIGKKKLYIFDKFSFGILDLQTKQWEIKNSNRDSGNLEYIELLGIQSCYLSNFEEIHIFARTKIQAGTYHLLLDDEKKYIGLNGFNRDELIRGHKLVYSEGCNKLLVCGGQKKDEFDGNWIDSNSIWICDIYKSFGQNYNWRELKCKLPYGGKTFCVVTAYKSIIIILYLRDNENKQIFCLDLLRNENSYCWIKSNYTFPFHGDCEYTDVITTDEDMIHCMYFSAYGHCKLSLFQIIPEILKNRYRLRFENYVKGYIRKKIGDEIFNEIPQTIINGILKYYSGLCV